MTDFIDQDHPEKIGVTHVVSSEEAFLSCSGPVDFLLVEAKRAIEKLMTGVREKTPGTFRVTVVFAPGANVIGRGYKGVQP